MQIRYHTLTGLHHFTIADEQGQTTEYLSAHETFEGAKAESEEVLEKLLKGVQETNPPKPVQGWVRCRFRASETDPRPINWPPPGPYWITGYGDGYSVIVAYCRTFEQVTEYWPEASHIEGETKSEIEFSDRFPNTYYRKREGS